MAEAGAEASASEGCRKDGGKKIEVTIGRPLPQRAPLKCVALGHLSRPFDYSGRYAFRSRGSRHNAPQRTDKVNSRIAMREGDLVHESRKMPNLLLSKCARQPGLLNGPKQSLNGGVQ